LNSSGLPVTYSLVSGPATLSNNIVSLSGVGTVVLKASQKGNDTYLAAPDVYRTFTVAPEYPNIALGKTVTVSSIFSTTSSYTGDKLVDGDKTSNGSRWLSEKNAGYPQWAEIDLGGDYIVNSFAFWTGYNGYINPITVFNLEFWNGNVWETIHSETGNLNAEFLAQIPEIKTNKIRLNLLDAEKPEARIFEIELYGYELEAANVALGKAVVASSSNGAYIASNLVDGDNSTNSSRWLPLDASLPQWFTISLGEDHVLQGINFWTGFDGYKNPISDFNLEIWKDGAWESVFFETNNIRSSYLKMFSPLQTTQIRFNITGADSIKMFEFEVYGNAGTLSIDNVLLNNNIELYPNPLINNELFIKANMQIDNVDIYNLLGVKQNSQLRNNKVYVDNLSSGIYIIKINNNLTRKFVKL
jgi:hypothetical protein